MLAIDCVTCDRLGVSCSGPQFAAMSPEELTDWMRRRKAALGLTNDDIATRAGVSIATVNRVFGGPGSNYRIETLSPILQVLLGGSWPAVICAAESGQQTSALRDRVHHLEGELSATRSSAGQTYDAAHDTIDSLRAQIDVLLMQLRQHRRLNYILGIMLFCVLVGIIWLLNYDLSNGAVGFFRH